MGIYESRIDIDRPALELVEDAYSLSKDHQTVRNEQYTDEYKLYRGYPNAADRDPDRANIFIPKIFSIVETKTPRDVKALLGARPYIPFEARREEFRESSLIQTEIIDEYCDRGQFYQKGSSALKIKNLYGTAFMDAIPYYENVVEKSLQPVVIGGQVIDTEIVERQVQRLRFRITEYAPWEIYVDPMARNLEEKGGCAYVIKIMLARRSEILDMAEKGMYPGLDIDELLGKDSNSPDKANHFGLQMLADLGLPQSSMDDGIGVLLRFESPERYIDLWNGRVVLRDIPNPFKHGMINLNRMIHVQDAHSQNAFWGIGEAQQNEILQLMLNDSWNMTFDAHNMNNHGITYYKNGAVNPDALVRTVGNKIGIEAEEDRPIDYYIKESFGQSLPQDHYAIPQTVERMMDLTSGVFELQRGEQSAGNRTATENALRKEFGDLRQEQSARLGEMVFLKSFGEKMISMVAQFANQDDIVEIVGEEKAQMLVGLNPADLPGGFNFTFKGANLVADQLIQQRNWKETLPIIMQLPNFDTEKGGRKTLELFSMDSIKDQEMIIPNEVLAQQGQQAAEQEKIDIEAQAQRDHQRDIELALVNGQIKERSDKLKDNKLKEKGKGATHSKKQPLHDSKSEAQTTNRELRKR